jgi:hypothetical protein
MDSSARMLFYTLITLTISRIPIKVTHVSHGDFLTTAPASTGAVVFLNQL